MFERLLITFGLTILGVGVFVVFRQAHCAAPARSPWRRQAGDPLFSQRRLRALLGAGRFLQQLQAEFGDQIVVEKVDADVEQAKAERYGVFTLPTTLIVDPQGTVRHANYGLADTRKLASQFRAVEVVALG